MRNEDPRPSPDGPDGRPAEGCFPKVMITAPAQDVDRHRLTAAWNRLCARHGQVGHLDIAGVGVSRDPVAMVTLDPAKVDAESVAVIVEELAAHVMGQPVDSAPLEASPFLAQLAARSTDAAQAFFETILDDIPISEPFGEMGQAEGAGMGQTGVELDEGATDRLRALVAACGGTLEQAVLLGWRLVEARWFGQPDLCLGLRVSLRRQLAGSDRLVGNLSATLPCPLRLTAETPLADALAGLRGLTEGIAAHAGIGLQQAGDAVEGLPFPRSWRTVVQFAEMDLMTRLRHGGRWPEGWTASHVTQALAPVTLLATDGARLHLSLEHDPARLAAPMARRMLAHLRHLLMALGSAGGTGRLADIDMMDQRERDALLRLGEPEKAVSPALPCPASRFEAMAALVPDRIALEDPRSGRQMRFADLDQRANGLAHRLGAAGVTAGDVVALCLPRGSDVVVAMLATLKLGASFLPMDPEQSEGWLQDMMRLSGARHMVVPAGRPFPFDGQTAVEVGTDLRTDPPSRPLPDAGRGAYVLFTSGSSGVPKAVLGLTGALSAHADAVISAYGLTGSDRILQFAGHTFDVFLEEVFPTLIAGGRVIFRDEQTASSANGFLDFVGRHRVTVLNLPAGFWHVLMQEMTERGLALPSGVRMLVAGSERVLPGDLRKWQQVAPGVGFINAYGPTETTITATAWTLPKAAPLQDPNADVPIGRPLGHATAVLLAHDGTLTPQGGTGVLWIGGDAVTGGYLGNPAKTDEVFRPDPWRPGCRLYRTGDMAQWRDDGQLIFHGRADRQVKLRGHRIDLNQVEAALLAVPGLRNVHVGLDQGKNGARLLAWVACDPALATEEVTAAVAEHLPDYMLPRLIRMEELPRKPGGKIDTKALPRPVLASPEAGGEDALARDVAACMAEILGLESVGIDQDFRDIGGDSLLAIRLVGLVEQRLGFSLQPTHLMGFPTARGLAGVISSERIHAGCTVTIRAEGTKPALFAVHVLGRNESFFRPLAEALGPDFPVYGMSAGFPRSAEEVEVERLARWYFDEVQKTHPKGPVAVVGFSLAAFFAFEVAQLLRAAGRDVCLLALIDVDGPGGRPSLQGRARFAAHLRQFRTTGARYLLWLARKIWEMRPSLPTFLRRGETGPFDLVLANERAVDAYRPRPYAGRIMVFRAADTFLDSQEAIRSGLGWAPVAQGGLDLVDVPGDHMSMLEAGNVDTMARHLAQALSRRD